ncbi:MAG: hypothetical protein PHY28_01685, partial [Dehalococcoidales bacterium]|nr:hypothetical protein [Dehalococcoidales bacterium]
MKYAKYLIIPMLVVMMGSVFAIGVTHADFTDTEASSGSAASGWASTAWTQTSQTDFNNGTLTSVETASSAGDVKLSIVPNPTMVVYDNSSVATGTSSSAQLVKTLNFTRNGSAYNEIRIDSNLKVVGGTSVTTSIRLNNVEIFTHTTTSSSYVNYSDVFDFSGYADGAYTIKLYMSVSGGNGYNQLFELYTTSPTNVDSDNAVATKTGDTSYTLRKTLTFTKSGSAYNNLRFDTNLRATGNTASLRIDINGTTAFTHSTSSTSYVTYNDALDFSGYADGAYTITLYLKIGNKNQTAYNSLFEIWRTDPALITSDNNEYPISGTLDWQLLKSLSFVKDGTSYDELRIDSNLSISGATGDSSIRIDDVQ